MWIGNTVVMTTRAIDSTCSCCGEIRPDSEPTGLVCHQQTRICRGCIRWLAVTSGEGLISTPVFPTADMSASTAFYRAAGFDVDAYDDGYAFVLRNGDEVLHLAATDELDPAHNQPACYRNTTDADD
jgi:hypothetical protein